MNVAKRVMIAGLLVGLVAGCSSAEPTPDEAPEMEQVQAEETVEEEVVEEPTKVEILQGLADGEHRSEEHRARNKYRNPAETLDFFGVEPNMTVVELSPGAGWYTEVIAPFLAAEGHLTAGGGIVDMEDTESGYTQRAIAYQQMLDDHSEAFGNVHVGTFAPPETVEIGEPGSVDMILTFRSMHGWNNNDLLDDVMAAAFSTLKEGGVFGVVTHRAAEGADPAETSSKGYLPQEYVIEHAEQAGFVLEDSSEINANPLDTRDYEAGVWALPPSLRSGEDDLSRYEEIGESDRMTLRFVKPEAAEEAAESAPSAEVDVE